MTTTNVGDVFEDCDPRMAGRRIKIVSIKDGHAWCRHLSGRGNRTRIRLDRLQPIGKKKGFRRVDALCPTPPNASDASPNASTDGAA